MAYRYPSADNTLDQGCRLLVNPSFETESELLQRTIINRAGERVPSFEGRLDTTYLAEYNAELAWV